MNLKETITILNGMSIDNKLDIKERAAVNEALMSLTALEHRDDTQVDFQGWEVKKLTMKDLRKFISDNDSLDDDVKLLVLEDDGMGYGARNGYCSDIYFSEDKDGNNEVQIWF